MMQTTVLLDTYSGASAPAAVVEAGARLSLDGRASVVLLGDEPAMQEAVGLHGYDPSRLRLVGVPRAYPPAGADPAQRYEAARIALPIAMRMLASGEADALISAAPPQRVLAAAEAHLERLDADVPPALAAVVPTMPRPSGDDPFALLLDVSGRRRPTDDPATMLAAHGRMGAAYSRVVSGVAQPSVAVLSTADGISDDNEVINGARRQLGSASGMRAVGTMRAVDIPRGDADVVVTDGFTGHAVRGLLEGLTQLTVDAARYAWKTRATWRVGLRLLSRGVGMLRTVNEYREYGGAPLLGVRGLVLVAHPESEPAAFENAIRLAAKCDRRGLIGELDAALASARPGGSGR